MKIKRIHHVAIAVRDMEPLEHLLVGDFGLATPHRESRPDRNLELAFFSVADAKIELLKATGPGSQVPDFIERRGEGLFHICLEVDDIDEAMSGLLAKGIRFRTDSAQPSHGGTRVVFLDPATTGGVLFELLEASKAA